MSLGLSLEARRLLSLRSPQLSEPGGLLPARLPTPALLLLRLLLLISSVSSLLSFFLPSFTPPPNFITKCFIALGEQAFGLSPNPFFRLPTLRKGRGGWILSSSLQLLLSCPFLSSYLFILGRILLFFFSPSACLVAAAFLRL